jgi:hypothetical protein
MTSLFIRLDSLRMEKPKEMARTISMGLNMVNNARTPKAPP